MRELWSSRIAIRALIRMLTPARPIEAESLWLDPDAGYHAGCVFPSRLKRPPMVV